MQMIDLMKRLAELDAKNPNMEKGVAEGSEFGSYYYEKVAQEIFNRRGDISSEDEVLNQAYKIVANDQGQKSARYMFNYDEDFPSDLLGAYRYLQDLQKQKQGVAEGYSVGMSDNAAAKKIASKLIGMPVTQKNISSYIKRYLDMVGRTEKDLPQLSALVMAELEKQGVAEGWGNDEVIRFENGYTAWIKKLTPYLNRAAQPHIWVYKTPEGVTSDAEAANKIKNLEPVAKFHSTQDMYDAMKNGTVGQQGVAEGLEEFGMMGGMNSQPHSPASINMTAATGEELSAMLKDIMTLAGQQHMHDPMGGEEPMSGTDGIATVDVEPSPEVGADSTSLMRSMIDKLNPSTDDEPEGDDDSTEPSDDDEEKVDEYDNTPAPKTAGYDSAVPSGNDLHREKQQFPAAQPGDNAMTMEQRLMAEYNKFINEN